MEFLRFGSSIPGSYWGCCAMCIIQNFKVDPDAKASIQLVDGDGGYPITGKGGGFLFSGPTYHDIFKQRLRIGTFSNRDMPNHGFLAVLTHEQVNGGVGKKWLKILKEEGFEFIRTVDNSVYTGESTIKTPGGGGTSSHKNYLFGLFRNIGSGAVADPFTPPSAWTDLPAVVPEAWEYMGGVDKIELNKTVQTKQLELYKRLGKPKFLTEEKVVAAGATVTLAGERTKYLQQSKAERERLKAHYEKAKPVSTAAKADPFAASPVPA